MASPAQVEVFMELTMCIGLKTRTALTVGEAIAKELAARLSSANKSLSIQSAC